MKAKVSETGLEATPVNPHEISNVVPMVGMNSFESYHAFEAANKSYPLTEYQEPRSIIECEDELVWQLNNGENDAWCNCYVDTKAILDSINHERLKTKIQTRQALKPIPQPEKIKEGTLDELANNFIDSLGEMWDESLHKCFIAGHHSANYHQHQATIDKVVALLQQSIKYPIDTKSQSTVGWNNAIDNLLTKIKTLTP